MAKRDTTIALACAFVLLISTVLVGCGNNSNTQVATDATTTVTTKATEETTTEVTTTVTSDTEYHEVTDVKNEEIVIFNEDNDSFVFLAPDRKYELPNRHKWVILCQAESDHCCESLVAGDSSLFIIRDWFDYVEIVVLPEWWLTCDISIGIMTITGEEQMQCELTLQTPMTVEAPIVRWKLYA